MSARRDAEAPAGTRPGPATLLGTATLLGAATRPGTATLLAAVLAIGVPGAVDAQSPLDFERYRSEVEPIFIAPRGGHGPSISPCATCHVKSGTPLALQPLNEGADGGVFWTEEQSRRNFEVVARLVVPGHPERSRLLLTPLVREAGGASFHVGGRFFDSREDPEWRAMARWVRDADSYPSGITVETPPALDFGFFRSCVQRVFLDKRDGRMQCVHCHGGGSRGFASDLREDRTFWDLEESQANFEVLRRYIEPGYPLRSRFLTHPLAPEAGGDPYHAGGRRWLSQDDPEWRMLAAWVQGETPRCVTD